jgi:hypothetical protein
MVFRSLIACAIALAVMAGCSAKKVTGPVITSTVYLGALYDSVLATQLAVYHITYAGTQYQYTLNSDNTFKVDENIGMGWTSPSSEEGTYAVSSATYTFTPTVDRHDNPATHAMVPVDTMRTVYTGMLSMDTLSIADFINIDTRDCQRNLGTLTLKKQ